MKRLLTAALALSLLGGATAFADPHGDHGDRGEHGDRGDRGDYRNDQGGYNRDRDRGYERADHHDNGHHWGRGQRLPREYYEDRGHYVDYRTYHLRRPPYGYRWVRTDDNDYAMVAIASGLIASLIYANR